MATASENMQYEVAQDLKESIEAIEYNKDKQVVEFVDNSNFDVVGIVEKDGYLSISILFYRNGVLLSTKEFMLEITTTVEETLRQFASQYYAANIEPDYILANIDFDH